MFMRAGSCYDNVGNSSDRASTRCVDDSSSSHPKRGRASTIQIDGIRHSQILSKTEQVRQRETSRTIHSTFRNYHIYSSVSTFSKHCARMRTIETFSSYIDILAYAISSDYWSGNYVAVVLRSPSCMIGSRIRIAVRLYRKTSILEAQNAIASGIFFRSSRCNLCAVNPKRSGRGEVRHIEITAVDCSCSSCFHSKSVCSQSRVLLDIEGGVHRRLGIFGNRNPLRRAVEVSKACFAVNDAIAALPAPIGIGKYRSIICLAQDSRRYGEENKQKRQSEFENS